MKSLITVGIALAVLTLGHQTASRAETAFAAEPAAAAAVEKGAKWLVSVQGADGGWGQDGGETSYVRTGERLESSGNDVANTAVAALALIQAGKKYQPQVDRAIAFILE